MMGQASLLKRGHCRPQHDHDSRERGKVRGLFRVSSNLEEQLDPKQKSHGD